MTARGTDARSGETVGLDPKDDGLSAQAARPNTVANTIAITPPDATGSGEVVLVPREATEAMELAGKKTIPLLKQELFGKIWSAMASAAPTLLPSEQGVVEALAVGEDFLNKCNSAWAAGEPAHRVKAMLDAADAFRAALAGANKGAG